MQITTVHYQRLVSMGNYENERVGAHAQVEEGETAEEALAKLTAWVEEQINARGKANDDLENIRRSIHDLEHRKERMERETKEAGDRWRAARAFLAKVGLELPRSYVTEEDIPF